MYSGRPGRMFVATMVVTTVLMPATFPTVQAGADGGAPVRVFVLAGQPNMQGKGGIEHFSELVGEYPEECGHLIRDMHQEYARTSPLVVEEGQVDDGRYHHRGGADTFYAMGVSVGEAMLKPPERSETASAPAGEPVETSGRTDGVRFDPVVQQIEGWTVYVDPSLLEGEHSEVGARALKMLANHLQRIAVLVPEEQLARMQKLEIWIEYHHPTLGAMQYHPSLDWLKSHGLDPRLAKKVHIPRAESLFSRHQMIKQPAVVLHELAHAYHDQYLGFDEPRIVEAYEKAKAAGTYERVLLYTGKRVRHYAMTDQKEYFAEGTEAYFYRNDFYPFVRAELKEHDPVLHDLLSDIWGPLQ